MCIVHSHLSHSLTPFSSPSPFRLNTLRALDAPSQQLLEIFPCLLPLLERGDETLRLSLLVLESYTLLFQDVLIANYGATLASIFPSLLQNLQENGVMLLYRVRDSAFYVSSAHY